MKKIDFMFVIGYQGSTALVDKKNAKKYKNSTIDELMQHGLYKPAFCYALYDNDEKEMIKVLNKYTEVSGFKFDSINTLKKVFGVYSISETVNRINYIY